MKKKNGIRILAYGRLYLGQLRRSTSSIDGTGVNHNDTLQLVDNLEDGLHNRVIEGHALKFRKVKGDLAHASEESLRLKVLP